MTRYRRAAQWLSTATLVAAALAGCGSGNGLDSDSPTTTHIGRFPVAVVSTTTPDTAPSGQVTTRGGTKSTTPTTRKSSTVTSTVAGTTTTSPPAADRVKPAETPLPVARSGVAGAAWQGLVIAAGGVGAGGGPSVRVDFFDPTAGEWKRGPNLPVALHDAGLAVLGDDLWIVGGIAVENDQPVAQSATYFSHPGDTEWHNGPSLHTARGGLAVATLGSFLVVLGGQTTDGTILDSVEVLAKGGADWKVTQPLSQARTFASALAMNGRIYAVGGTTAASTAVNTVESWRAGSSGWRSESRLDSERSGAGGAGACVAGGQNAQGVVANIECFATGFWVVQGQMRVPRHGMAAVALDGWLHLVGGDTAGTTVTNTHEVVDIAAS